MDLLPVPSALPASENAPPAGFHSEPAASLPGLYLADVFAGGTQFCPRVDIRPRTRKSSTPTT